MHILSSLSCFLRDIFDLSIFAVDIYCYLTAATQKHFIRTTTFDLIYADCRMDKNTRIIDVRWVIKVAAFRAVFASYEYM